MIIITIIIGIIALLVARASGLTDTWLGTGAIAALILYMLIAALPQAQWLFDSLWLVAIMWAMLTTFYHRLLADKRRCAPMRAGRRSGVVWSFGRVTVGIAVGVTA
jgi:hypothetical protein